MVLHIVIIKTSWYVESAQLGHWACLLVLCHCLTLSGLHRGLGKHRHRSALGAFKLGLVNLRGYDVGTVWFKLLLVVLTTKVYHWLRDQLARRKVLKRLKTIVCPRKPVRLVVERRRRVGSQILPQLPIRMTVRREAGRRRKGREFLKSVVCLRLNVWLDHLRRQVGLPVEVYNRQRARIVRIDLVQLSVCGEEVVVVRARDLRQRNARHKQDAWLGIVWLSDGDTWHAD